MGQVFTYDYARPAVTADIVVVRCRPMLQVLLIQRGKEPFKGMWALPGGHVEENEDLARAAVRELREETGIVVDPIRLRQTGAYGRPGRDPRGHYITVAYLVDVPHHTDVVASDDAAKAQWFSVHEDLPELAFDHRLVLVDALEEF